MSSVQEFRLKVDILVGSLASQDCKHKLPVIRDFAHHHTNLDHTFDIIAFSKGLDLRLDGLGDYAGGHRLVVQ